MILLLVRILLYSCNVSFNHKLFAAKSLPATIRLINLAAKRFVAYYRRVDKNYRIDAVSFNKLSGELVVTFTVVGKYI